MGFASALGWCLLADQYTFLVVALADDTAAGLPANVSLVMMNHPAAPVDSIVAP